MAFFKNLWTFLTETIFLKDERNYRNGLIRWGVRQYKLLFYTARGLDEHDTLVRSAALTFYTLMSIVPIAALVFAVVKGFGLADGLMQNLYSLFPHNREVVDYLITFADKALAAAQGGVVAFVGIVMLFWAVVRVFGSVEEAFNNIWEVKVSRSFTRQFTDYIAVVVITPILWVVGSTAGRYAGHLLGIDSFGALYTLLSGAVSLLGIWAMFSFIYVVVPNTRVRLGSAVMAGIVAGTLFLAFQWGYVWLQRYMTSYNAIYGSFAALPLFLIWVQWSWQILLFGGELAFAYQNISRFAEERESLRISYDHRRQVTLAVMLHVARIFRDGHGPVSAVEIHTALRLPTRIVNDVLFSLVTARLLVAVRSESDDATQTIYSYYAEAVINDVLNDLVEQKGVSRDTARTLLYSGGYQVYSCYDPSIQQAIDDVYTDLDKMPQRPSASGQQFESAIVIMDPYTGEIKGLSGGTDKKTINFGTNRATQSKRPPGSSIKPIATYGPAMELGLITQYTQVNDSPDIKLSGTSWYPKNSGGGNYGVITIREALQRSLNTVSAQILDKLTPRASYEFLKDKLGVTSLAESDCDYAPLALGQLTNGITVREMTQAYSAFVNDGVFTYGRTYSYVKDSSGEVVLENPARTIVAFKANTAWNMADMLCNAVNSGTGTEARLTGMPVGGKTGTTTNNCDRWFVGFTPYYVAAVWTGYDMPEYMNFSGNPAAQIWKLVMESIHKDLPTKSFPTPTIGSPTGIFGNFSGQSQDTGGDADDAG